MAFVLGLLKKDTKLSECSDEFYEENKPSMIKVMFPI